MATALIATGYSEVCKQSISGGQSNMCSLLFAFLFIVKFGKLPSSVFLWKRLLSQYAAGSCMFTQYKRTVVQIIFSVRCNVP